MKKEQKQAGVDRRSWLKRMGVGALAAVATMMTTKKVAAQQNIHAYWMQGNVARAQFPDLLDLVEHRPTGTLFQGQPGTENWFHVPLSAPSFLNQGRPQLLGATVYMKTSNDVFLRESKLTDGIREVGALQDLSETGDIFHQVSASDSTFDLGLCISVRMEFTNQAGPAQVEVIGAGADIEVPL